MVVYYLYIDLRNIFGFYNGWVRYKYKGNTLYSSITTYMGRLNVNLGGYFSWSFTITMVDNLQIHYYVF